MNKRFKKLLSSVMVAVMFLSFIPGTAMAVTGEPVYMAAWFEDGTASVSVEFQAPIKLSDAAASLAPTDFIVTPFVDDMPQSALTINSVGQPDGTSKFISLTLGAAYTAQNDANTFLEVKILASAVSKITDNASGIVWGATADQFQDTNLIDKLAPLIEGGMVSADKAGVMVKFSEGVFTDLNKTGALTPSDFNVTVNSGDDSSISAVTITSLINPDSGAVLVGGEDVVKFNLDFTGTPDDDDSVQLTVASGTSVYDGANLALAAGATTGPLSFGPAIVHTSFSSNGIEVSFNRGLFSNNNGQGALLPSDFTVSVDDGNDGGIIGAAIDTVTNFDGTALQGGENGVLFRLKNITGTPDSNDSVIITVADGSSVFDGQGAPLPAGSDTGSIFMFAPVPPIDDGTGGEAGTEPVTLNISNLSQDTNTTTILYAKPAVFAGVANTASGEITGVTVKIFKFIPDATAPQLVAQPAATFAFVNNQYEWSASLANVTLTNGGYTVEVTATNSASQSATKNGYFSLALDSGSDTTTETGTGESSFVAIDGLWSSIDTAQSVTPPVALAGTTSQASVKIDVIKLDPAGNQTIVNQQDAAMTTGTPNTWAYSISGTLADGAYKVVATAPTTTEPIVTEKFFKIGTTTSPPAGVWLNPHNVVVDYSLPPEVTAGGFPTGFFDDPSALTIKLYQPLTTGDVEVTGVISNFTISTDINSQKVVSFYIATGLSLGHYKIQFNNGTATEDAYFNVIEPAAIKVRMNGNITTQIAGLKTIKVEAISLPVDFSVESVTLSGTSNMGTAAETSDDVNFNLIVPNDFGYFALDAQLVKLADFTSSSGTQIPVNPNATNAISLNYTDTNTNTAISTSLTWNPVGLTLTAPATAGEPWQLALTNSDVVNTDKVLLTGVLAGTTEKNFSIVLFKDWLEPGEVDLGNFSRNLTFVEKSLFTQTDINLNPDQVPVTFGVDNSITFTYSEGTDPNKVIVIQKPFTINPGTGNGSTTPGFEWANTPESTYHVITEIPVLDVKVGNFNGEIADLSVELYFNDNSTSTKVASLTAVAEITGAEGLQTGERLFRFTPVDAVEAASLAQTEFNGVHLEAKLVYDDPNGTQYDKKQSVNFIQVDNLAPGQDIHVEFDQIMASGDYTGKYRLKVHINDSFGSDPTTNTLVPANFVLVRGGVEVVDSGKAVELYRETWETNTTDPFRNVYLYVSDIKFGDVLRVKNLTDLAGHTMTAPVDKVLKLDSRVVGQIRGIDPSTGQSVGIPNAQAGFAPYSETTGLDLGEGKVRWVNADATGSFDFMLPMGTYRVLKVQWDEGNLYKDVYVDQYVSVPALGQDQTHTVNINLPPTTPNVINGQTNRLSDEIYVENLVFVNTDFLSALEGVNFGHLIQVNVNTDGNGAFSTYLPPGTYKLIGKHDGSLTPPILSVEITVPATGVLDLTGVDIRFPGKNVFGSIADAAGPIPHAFIGIIGLDAANAGRTMANADHEGNFGLAMADGNYKLGVVRVMPPPPEYTPVTGTTTEPTPPISLTVPEVQLGYSASVSQMASGFTGLTASSSITVQLFDSYGTEITDGVVANSVVVDADSQTVQFQLRTGLNSGKYEVGFNDGTASDLWAVFKVAAPPPVQRNGGLYFLDVTFTVTNGVISSFGGVNLKSGSTNTSLNVGVPNPNVTVKLTEGGSTVTDEGRLVFTYGTQKMEVTGRGTFNFYLTPGATYTFVEAELWGMNWRKVTLNDAITVDATTNLTGLNAHTIDLLGSANVLISFKKEVQNQDGSISLVPATEASGYGLGIEKEGSYEFFWNNANDNGQIYLQLAPGKYKINGYDTNGQWKEFRKTFDVTELHTKDNQLTIDIVLKAPNVTGVVLDKLDNPIANAWVNVKKLPAAGELFSQYFGFNTDASGQFGISLEAGEYVVEGVSTYQQWYEIQLPFTVVAGIPLLLTIQKPADNVTGTIYKSYTDAGNNVKYSLTTYQEMGLELVQLGIPQNQVNESPWLYRKWVKVNDDGTFGINLEVGIQYAVSGLTTYNRFIEFDPYSLSAIKFTVGTDSADRIIAPPTPNFAGVARDFDGNLITRGWVNVEKADFTEWNWMPLETDGTFAKALQNGAEYIIREVIYYAETDWDTSWNGPKMGAKEKRLNLNRKVTIGTDTGTLVLSPNFKGTINVSGMNLGDTSNFNVGAIIRPDKDWSLMTEDEKNNPWKYEAYASLQIDASGVGTFYAYLNAGDGSGKKYILAGIPAPTSWIEINEPFTIGNPLSVDGKYTMSFDLTQNVTGNIKDSSNSAVANAWVDFREVLDQTSINAGQYERWFGTTTNASGDFGLKLKEGTYRLNGYHIQGTWVNNMWEPGKWTEVGYKFKVNSVGQMTDMNGNTLTSISIKPNVFGVVQNYYRSGDDLNWIVEKNPAAGQLVTIKNAWLTVKPATGVDYTVNKDVWNDAIWANSGNDGKFNLMLSPGQYKIIEAGGMNSWMQLDIRLNVAADGTLTVTPADYLDADGNLVIKPPTPNVKGNVYKSYTNAETKQILKSGWMAIKPASLKDWEWNDQVRWVEIKNGYFETKLPDGNWKIADVNGYNYWHKYDAAFSVSGNTITPDQSWLVDSSGMLFVAPPANNFVGVVKNSAGLTVALNSWITIKPQSAGEYDWEGAIGFETDASGQFSTYIKPGDYRVVSAGSYAYWFELNIPFTINSDGTVTINPTYWDSVNNQVIIKEPTSNVSATVYANVAGTPTPVTQGWLGIARYNAAGTQVKMNGTAITASEMNQYDVIQWQFTKWFNTDQTGKFTAALDTTSDGGYYRILHVNGLAGVQWVNYVPKLRFEVTESGAVLKGTATALTAVNEPTANVTIRIAGVTSAASEGWLDLSVTKDGKKIFMPINFKQKTDGVFEFASYLEDGNYRVQSFGTWDFYKEIKKDFSVPVLTDGVLTINLQDTSLKVVQGTITGGNSNSLVTIQKVVVVDGVDVLTTDEANSLTAKANEIGQFTFELMVGETWAVVNINTPNGFQAIADPLVNKYTVTDSTEVQTPWPAFGQ